MKVVVFLALLLVATAYSQCVPTLVGSYATPRNVATDFAVSADGSTTYVALGTNKLLVLQTSNPCTPRKLASPSIGDSKTTIASLGITSNSQNLFVATNGGMKLVDVSDRTTPEITASSAAMDAQFTLLSNDESTIYAVAAAGGIHALDLSLVEFDTAKSSDKATATLSPDNSLLIVNDDADGIRIFQTKPKLSAVSRYRFSEDARHSAMDANLLIAAFNNGGLHFINLTTPKNPTKIGALTLKTGKARFLDLVDGYPLAIVALGQSGVGLVNYTDPTNPVLVASLPVNQNDIFRVKVHPTAAGLFVLALSDEEFSCLDFSSCIPEKPEPTSSESNPTSTSTDSSSTTQEPVAYTTNEILSGLPDEKYNGNDSGSAVLAIIVVGSVAVVGVSIYAVLYVLKRKKLSQFDREYQSVTSIPLEEMS